MVNFVCRGLIVLIFAHVCFLIFGEYDLHTYVCTYLISKNVFRQFTTYICTFENAMLLSDKKSQQNILKLFKSFLFVTLNLNICTYLCMYMFAYALLC